MHETARIDGHDGSFAAYVARPSLARAPAVVVVHEVFGVNADMRESCDELARQGYLAVCPDLFWRLEPGLDLTDRTEAERGKAYALYRRFDLALGVRDIAATVEAVRQLPQCDGKVGIVGYCLGGLLTLMAAERVQADAAVAYYPGNADKHLDEIGNVRVPLMIHLAGQDEYIPAPAQEQIIAAAQGASSIQVHRYAGCGHAFARHQGIAFDAAASALANFRTLAFLSGRLDT